MLYFSIKDKFGTKLKQLQVPLTAASHFWLNRTCGLHIVEQSAIKNKAILPLFTI